MGKSAKNLDTISIGLVRKGESEPYEIVVKEIPKGFPADYLPKLGEFYRDGFSDGQIFTQHPRLRIPPRRGRAVDPVARRLGEMALRLRNQGLSYGQIALRICEKKDEEGHQCDRKCADRMRQRARASRIV
jgi:hypothetical protein